MDSSVEEERRKGSREQVSHGELDPEERERVGASENSYIAISAIQSGMFPFT